MTTAQTDASTPRKPLRLWPGVVLLILQWLGWFVVPFFFPATRLYGLLVGVVCGLAIVVWWMFFSRAPWVERVGALVLMVIAPIGTKFIVHKSIAGGGMGMLIFILVVPMLSLALVAWAVASRRLSVGPRRVALVAAILLACGVFTLIRTGGITADFQSDFHWRWTKTPEERLLAQGEERLAPTSISSASAPLPAAAGVKTEPPIGPAFADQSATASFAACRSKQTGQHRRQLKFGADRLDRAGHPSPFAAGASIHRSSAVTTR